MLSAILSLLGLLPKAFNTVDNITNAISNERIRQIDAKTEQDKIRAQERINSLQAKRDVLVAESAGSRFNSFVRGGIGTSVGILIAKFLVWDKVIGSFWGCAGKGAGDRLECMTFRTDILDSNQWAIVTAVIGFYFLYEGAVNVTRIAKS